MTLMPAVLVLIVGSELIRNSVDRWFNAPMDEILSSANEIAGDYYQRAAGAGRAIRRSGSRATLAGVDLTDADVRPMRDLRGAGRHAAARPAWSRSIASAGRRRRCRSVDAGRRRRGAGAAARVQPRASADRLAAQALAGAAETQVDRAARRRRRSAARARADPIRAGRPARPASSSPATT